MPPRKRSPEDTKGRAKKEVKQTREKRDRSPEDAEKGKRRRKHFVPLKRTGRAVSAERTPREQRQRNRDMSLSPVSNPVPPSQPRGRTMERTTASNRVSTRSVDNLVSRFRRLALESPQEARQILRPVARRAARK